jgi:hypothetical protein
METATKLFFRPQSCYRDCETAALREPGRLISDDYGGPIFDEYFDFRILRRFLYLHPFPVAGGDKETVSRPANCIESCYDDSYTHPAQPQSGRDKPRPYIQTCHAWEASGNCETVSKPRPHVTGFFGVVLSR